MEGVCSRLVAMALELIVGVVTVFVTVYCRSDGIIRSSVNKNKHMEVKR